jgi:hypothetical protein
MTAAVPEAGLDRASLGWMERHSCRDRDSQPGGDNNAATRARTQH